MYSGQSIVKQKSFVIETIGALTLFCLISTTSDAREYLLEEALPFDISASKNSPTTSTLNMPTFLGNGNLISGGLSVQAAGQLDGFYTSGTSGGSSRLLVQSYSWMFLHYSAQSPILIISLIFSITNSKLADARLYAYRT